MLLNEITIIKWNVRTKKHYEEKGYIFTKFGDEFEIKTEDLTHGSHERVNVKCDCEDCKNPYLKPIVWKNYIRYVKEDGKYYCAKCSHKLFSAEKLRKILLDKGTSFEKWCLNNNKQDVFDRWDYELNGKNPDDINCNTPTTYWFKCPKGLHKSELKHINYYTQGHEGSMYCNACNSFECWCITHKREDILIRWDYEKNNCLPIEISYGTMKKYYFKCPIHIHSSELKNINNFTNGSEGSIRCNQCNSFEQWCIDNDRQDILNRWDYELNDCNPIEIPYGTEMKKYFKCPQGIHRSELKVINHFTISHQEGSMRCNQCNSFAQYLINMYGDYALELYWDYKKNNELKLNPWEIDRCSGKEINIYCQEQNYHKSYKTSCDNFVEGKRCPLCCNHHGNVHIEDSLGTLFPQVLEIWSDKNIKSPFECTPYGHDEIWWKCPDGKHIDYLRIVKDSNTYEFRCPECGFYKGEKKIEEWLLKNCFKNINEYDCGRIDEKNKYYKPQKKFDGLLGLKNGQLSYDFYLPNHNLLIEYQGEQHEKPIAFFGGEEQFIKQVEHDKRKKQYAKDNNIKLLPIWYYDYDNIEIIIDNYLKEVNKNGI